MAAIQKSYVNDRLWTNIAGRVQSAATINQQHPHASGSMNFATDPRVSMPASTTLTPQWSEILSVGRTVAKHFSRVTRALYGITGDISPAYNAYGYFYVDSSRHPTHYNNVETQITNYSPANPSPAGMSLSQIETHYNALSNILINNAGQETPDLRICHGSCHVDCHASRGRR